MLGLLHFCSSTQHLRAVNSVRASMASHSLVIAKASLSAVLMRPDPTTVPRDQIAHFHELLDMCLVQCSPTNIQV